MVKREFAELWMKNANLASMEEAKRQVELFIETMKEAKKYCYNILGES